MKKRIKHYLQSSYDGSWWIVYKEDCPNKFYGMNPPKRSKFKIIHSPKV